MVKCSVAPSVRVLWLRKLLLYLVPLRRISPILQFSLLPSLSFRYIIVSRHEAGSQISQDLLCQGVDGVHVDWFEDDFFRLQIQEELHVVGGA